MKNKIKVCTIGVLVMSLLMMSVPGMAASIKKSISVIFNSVTVKCDGKSVSGDNILYNGNVYVRADKISETMGKKFNWNKSKNTIDITSVSTSTPKPTDKTTIVNGYKSLYNYRNVYYKFGDDGLYQYKFLYPSEAFVKDDTYYFGVQQTLIMLNLLAGNYTTEKTDNPYLKGIINYIERPEYSLNTKREYQDISTAYIVGSISSASDKTKVYPFSEKKGEELGGVLVNGTFIMNIDEVFDYFGYKNQIKIECDDKNKCLVVQISTSDKSGGNMNKQEIKNVSSSFVSINNVMYECIYGSGTFDSTTNTCSDEQQIQIPLTRITRNGITKTFCNFNPSYYTQSGSKYYADGNLLYVLRLALGEYQSYNTNNPYANKKILLNYYSRNWTTLNSNISLTDNGDIYTSPTNKVKSYSYEYNGKKITTLNNSNDEFVTDNNGIEFYNGSFICLEDLFKYWEINKSIEYTEKDSNQYYLIK